MFDKEGFVQRLRASREALRLRQGEVAERLGITRSAYVAYEAGRTTPPLEAIMALLEILNVSFDWLTKGEGEPQPKTVVEPPAADAREIEQKYIKALETLVGQQEEIIKLKEQLLDKKEEEKKREAERSEKL